MAGRASVLGAQPTALAQTIVEPARGKNDCTKKGHTKNGKFLYYCSPFNVMHQFHKTTFLICKTYSNKATNLILI